MALASEPQREPRPSVTKQIHLPEPGEPALKPPLALLVGKGNVKEKIQRIREDQERFLHSCFPTSGTPAINEGSHLSSHF